MIRAPKTFQSFFLAKSLTFLLRSFIFAASLDHKNFLLLYLFQHLSTDSDKNISNPKFCFAGSIDSLHTHYTSYSAHIFIDLRVRNVIGTYHSTGNRDRFCASQYLYLIHFKYFIPCLRMSISDMSFLRSKILGDLDLRNKEHF